MTEKVNPGDDDSQSRPEGAGKAEKKSESKKPNGESKKAKEKESRQGAQARKEREGREQARKEREEQRAKGPTKKIDFIEVREAVKVITAIQDEKKITISPDELIKLKKLLIDYGGLDYKSVEKMAPEEIVVEAQSILRHAEVTSPKEEELEEGENLSVIKEEIKQAQSADEEELTEDKVEDYLEVVGAGGEPPEEPPVTAEAAGEGEEPQEPQDKIDQAVQQALQERFGSRRPRGKHTEEEYEAPTKKIVDSLIDLKKQGKTTGAEWDQPRAKLEQILAGAETQLTAERASYKNAYFVSKAIRRCLADYRDQLPEDLRLRLEQFLDEKEGAFAKLNRQFQERYQELSRNDQNELVGDIEREATSYYKQIVSGFGVRISEAKELLLDMIGDDPTGLREWRAVALSEGFDNAIRITQLFETPVIWEEIPQKIGEVYHFVESTDLSVEDMQETIQRAIVMIRNIAPDTPEGRATREGLIKDLDAFRAFHSMRITMERQDMNPKDMLGVFQTYFDDETWMVFADRFSRDSQGRNYVDNNGQELNPFDVSFELYSAKLRDERILMNMVEAMTMHSIGHKFGGSALSEIKEYCGFKNLPDEWKGKFEEELEKLREYFAKKLGGNVSEWGKKKSKKMKEVIQNWHTKKTLQGAFWRASEDDLSDLADEFGITEEKASKRFLGREFLDIRREQLRDELEEKLRDFGLKAKDGKSVDFAELTQSGFLESIDYNAYYTTWMFEWSNYDSIRIFNRESRSHLDDDFDDIVFHQNTHMFFGRHIDHIWEFYHDENENRGRAKENDVNRIWKQYLPGKHHYLFPQNSLMVRWAEYFMTQEQKDKVKSRTLELMSQSDFDNEKYHDEFFGWMKSVAVMDMIENGEFTFGQRSGEGEKGNFRFSNVAKNLKKFEMVDVFVDRDKHRQFAGPEIFQDYLANPNERRFIGMNSKVKEFYSTRDARLFPWMTLALRAHWELANKHRLRLFDRPNLTAEAGEKLTGDLISIGQMERKQGEKEKRNMFGFNRITGVPFSEFLGTTPFRRIRQGLEDLRQFAWEFKLTPTRMTVAGLWEAIVAFFKQLPKELSR